MSGRATALKRARQIREVMLDYGVPEVSIELVAGRPTSGDRWNALDPVAVMSHHIASNPTPANPTPGLALVKRGRSDLPGPLCNGTAGVDLVYRIVTLGLANHSGHGGAYTVRGPLGAFTIPKDIGRPYIWGTEYEGGYTDAVWDREYRNKRTGKTMTFREFMGRANAALAEAIWLPGINSRGLYSRIEPGMDLAGYHMEHKTWAPGRKPDRRNYSTAEGRRELRRYARKTPATKQQEDDMAWEGKEVDIIPAPKVDGQYVGGYSKKNDTATPKHALGRTWGAAEAAAKDAAVARAHAEANSKKLDILVDRSMTEAERDQRLRQVADELAGRLAQIEVVVTAEVQKEN